MALNAPADSAPSRSGPRAGRLLDDVWIAAGSAQTTIALAVLLAFTFAIAALLPQLPPGLDPAAANRWLSTTAARFGRFGPFLLSSGLLDLLTSPWMIVLLALTGFHLVLRAANQARHLLARRYVTRTGALPLPPHGLPFELIHLPEPVASLSDKIAQLAQRAPRHVLAQGDLDALRPRVDAFFERRGRAAIGPLLTYLGPLILAGGLLWNALGGWRVAGVVLAPGRVVQPPQAGGLALSLVDAGSADGQRPGVLSLTRGAETRHAWLGESLPAAWGAVWISQRSSGPALAVRATRGATPGGPPLPLESLAGEGATGGALHLRFAENENEQGFTVPAANLAFRVVSYESLPERGISRPVFLVEGYQGTEATPGLDALIEDEGAVTWQGVTLTLQRSRTVVVDLAALPGLPLLALGALVLLVGAAITAYGGLTRTWINAAADRDGTLVAVRAAAPALGQAQVAAVAAQLAAASNDPENGEARAAAGRRKRELGPFAVVLAAAMLLAGAALAGARGLAGLANLAQPVLTLYAALALVGLAASAVGAMRSVLFAVRQVGPGEVFDPALPPEAQAMRGRPGNPGRREALLGFPVLSAALLVGSVWGLLSAATPLAPAPGALWLLATWLLGAAYLHATSGWRPLRIGAWLPALLAILALVAAVAAAWTASSLFTL